MTATVLVPAAPRPVPPLEVDPAGIRAYGTDLLAASAQVDDLGTFVAGTARIADWSGLGAVAYHREIAPIGRQADAMSLALRGVARRVDAHADTMEGLLQRRLRLLEEAATLARDVATLRSRATGAAAEHAAALQADCDDCAVRVARFEADLDAWAIDVMAEEEGMRATFDRVPTLGQAERRHGGLQDPADAALDAMPAPGAGAVDVRRWWHALTRQEQLAVVAAAPGLVGNLDGLPASDRDAANRVALERDLADWGHLESLGLLTPDEAAWLENARAAQHAVALIEREVDQHTGEPVPAQLYAYDPAAFDGDGAVAVAAGDLERADNVAVTVPGFGTDGESAVVQGDRALTLYQSARFLDGSQSVACLSWIGYDAPDNVPWGEGWDAAGVVSEAMATAGGERLADLVDGLRASRDGEPAHLTAIGHSYGSTTAGHAAHDQGIAVDDLVFVGSPGVGGGTDSASDTGVDPDHVWAATNSRDVIADLGNHGAVHLETLGGGGLGDDPAEDDFGARRIRAESVTRAEGAGLDDHAKYFDHGTESLWNISQVVTGNYEAVQHAGHVIDPWYTLPRDPEWDREPTVPNTYDEAGLP